MKWAIIGIIALVVLGGIGYGVYRWTSIPEQAEEWMSEQDLKNFPTQARREVKELKDNLAEYKETKFGLEKDIIAREGRADWSNDVKSDTIVGYDEQIAKYDKAIKDIVGQVKGETEKLVAAGTVDANTGKVPADHQFSITIASGKTVQWTQARAIEETDKLATDVEKFNRKKERQQRIVDAKKEYVKKLDDAVARLEKKIEEMEEFIEDMETELELLKIEEDIAEINKSIAGESDDNRFGSAVRKFREKKKEFLAEKELAVNSEPKDDGYFSEDDSKASGSSASYWN